MNLSTLLREAGFPEAVRGEAEVLALVADSRLVRPGTLFAVYPGGERFMESARDAGAVAALVSTAEAQSKAAGLGLATARVETAQFGLVAHAFHGFPSRAMKTLGVTGTNGKTTVAWLVRDMVSALGRKAAYLGTLGFEIDALQPLENTTPMAVEVAAMMAAARDAGCECFAMEVSSHALSEGRVSGVEFDVAVFTNLTQDHLDFHGTMEAYAAAKKTLFTTLPPGAVSVVNLNDPTGRAWAASLGGNVVGFRQGGPALEGGAGVRAKVNHVGLEEIALTLDDGTWMEEIEVPLGGTYNVENVLAAFAGVMALHFERWLGADFDSSENAFSTVAQSLENVRPVPGRFEPIPNGRGVGAIVDYAHTPDALGKLLDAVRPLTKGRIITVFGCGGDRDRTKRPIMGRIASLKSDVTVITSDNPRTEDPESILREVAVGIEGESVAIVDRKEAIAYAVAHARPGDVIVLAGKGHEEYQIVGRDKLHLSDRELLREALA